MKSVSFGVTLLLLTVITSVAAAQLPAPHLVYPEGAQIIDVKRDFGAKGDGQTDDTAPLQAAIVAQLSGDYRNPRMIYLPKGVYLVSDTLKSRITDAPPGQGGWCDGWRSGTFVVGESHDETIIRLKDNAEGFDNPKEPKPVLVNGSTGHGKGHDSRIGGWGNEAFQNTYDNFTIDTGNNNPGAVGVDFLASNRGGMYNIHIVSGDGQGVAGLDMTRSWPGPGLIKNVSIDGFDHGIRQRGMDASMTFEHITLTNQRLAGIHISGSPFMSLRKVISHNEVPVLKSERSDRAMIMLVDCEFTYTGSGDPPPAIENQGNLLLQRANVTGYSMVVDNEGKELRDDLEAPADGFVSQYLSREPLRLFPGSERLPNLSVKETPRWMSSDLNTWANVRDFGAGPAGEAVNFTTQVEFTRVDETVNFGWGGGGPGDALGNDNFAIRWTGEIAPPEDGQYTFSLNINDRGRLWVDGQLLVDEWEGYHSGSYSGKIRLTGGRRAAIKIEYWESGHDAWCRFGWSGPGVEKGPVPKDVLYPSADSKEPTGLTGAYYGNRNPSNVEAIQQAIDSGAEVVYFPNAKYEVDGTVILRRNVKKLIGMEATLQGAEIRFDGPKEDGVAYDVAFIEHLNGVKVIHNCDKTLVIRRCNLGGYENTRQGTGDVFLEDNMGARPYLNHPQNLWARQLNVEYGRKPMLINHGGRVWVLGMKVEGMFPSAINRGGVMEIYGLYSMTNPPPDRDMPMLINETGDMAVSFADGGQHSFFTHVKETRDGETRVDDGWRRETMMYIGGAGE